MFIRNSEALRSAGWTVDYPPCFLRKPSSCDVQLSTPRDVPKIRMFQHAATIRSLENTQTFQAIHLFGVELSSIKNSTAPPRKRHPHPITVASCIYRAGTPNTKKKLPPVPSSTTRCEWLDFCQPTGSQTAIGNPQKQLKGTNAEYKNTIWYALRHFEKNYDL